MPILNEHLINFKILVFIHFERQLKIDTHTIESNWFTQVACLSEEYAIKDMPKIDANQYQLVSRWL